MTPEKRNPWIPHGGCSFNLMFPHNHLVGDLHEFGAAGVFSPCFLIVAILGLIVPLLPTEVVVQTLLGGKRLPLPQDTQTFVNAVLLFQAQ